MALQTVFVHVSDPPHHQLPRVPHRLDVPGGGVHAPRERIVTALPRHHGITGIQEAPWPTALQGSIL